MIGAIYRDGANAESIVHKWFSRFRSEYFDLERSGRPSVVDYNQIETLIKNNPSYTTPEIAEILHISLMSNVKHLRTLVYMNHYEV